MTTSWAEVAACEFEEVTRRTWTPDPRWSAPGALALAIDPNVRQTPAFGLIDFALVDVEAGRCDRLIASMSPQEGKGSRVTTVGPLWFRARNPDRRIAIVSYAQSLAQGFGRDISTYITNNSGDEGVLDDRRMKGTPLEWATAPWNAVLDWNADEVIIENNRGGEMVLEIMRSAWNHIHKEKPATRMVPRVIPVHASQSKRTRAESIALFETGKVKHADDGTGRLTLLEAQMLTRTGTGYSPDRIDALVHGLTVLFLPQHSDVRVATRPTQQRWAGMCGR